MQIKTKYEIGQKVWVIHENRGEVCIYDDTISEICVTEEGLHYLLKESCNELKEDDAILYDEKEKLLNEIESLMQEIHNKEAE